MVEDCKRTDCKDIPLYEVLMDNTCFRAIEYGMCRRFTGNILKGMVVEKNERI